MSYPQKNNHYLFDLGIIFILFNQISTNPYILIYLNQKIILKGGCRSRWWFELVEKHA